MTACMPLVRTRAAAEVTLKSPPSVTLEVQEEKLPDSKPSEKIESMLEGVLVGVGVEPPVLVGVGVFVCVEPVILISHTLPSFSVEFESLSMPRSLI